MPDVGLTSSAERLKEEYKVVIKYTIEIEGLPVYAESYDAARLRNEVIGCRDRRGFSACLTRCLLDGKICDEGHKEANDR